MNTKKLSFSKKSRLTSKYQFMHTLKSSHKIAMQEIITFIKINNLNFPRIGITLSKKYIKHAYKRNRIKRIIRESFRTHQYSLPKMDFVITIKKNVTNINDTSIKQILDNTWRYSYDINRKIINTANIRISNTHQPVIR